MVHTSTYSGVSWRSAGLGGGNQEDITALAMGRNTKTMWKLVLKHWAESRRYLFMAAVNIRIFDDMRG